MESKDCVHPGGLASASEATTWDDVADEALEAVQARAEKFVSKASDLIYEDLLTTVQLYLTENAKFNIAETVLSAKRQAQADRDEASRCRAIANQACAERDSLRSQVEGLKEALLDIADIDFVRTASQFRRKARDALAALSPIQNGEG